MATFLFHFDDVKATLNGHPVFVAGSFDVHYGWQPAEPDVGIMSGYVNDIYIEDAKIDVTVMDEDGNDLPPHTFMRGSDAYIALESALDAKMQDAANDAANDPKDDDY